MAYKKKINMSVPFREALARDPFLMEEEDGLKDALAITGMRPLSWLRMAAGSQQLYSILRDSMSPKGITDAHKQYSAVLRQRMEAVIEKQCGQAKVERHTRVILVKGDPALNIAPGTECIVEAVQIEEPDGIGICGSDDWYRYTLHLLDEDGLRTGALLDGITRDKFRLKQEKG